MATERISAGAIAALEGLDDWRFVLGSIEAHYRFPSFGAAAAFVASLGAAADAAEHHPDVDLRYPGVVRVVLRTHAEDAVTSLDVELARTAAVLAADAGAVVQTAQARALEVCIDSMDADRIRPFWAAVLGYREVGGGILVDPLRIGPPMWFQEMDVPREERQRFHLDVTVPHDVALERIDAALAAGGRMVDDTHARAWWVLGDADGNLACISTWQDRS
jgi:4a-hydroxytetrahydrobiopterin dehydratase